MNRFLTAMLLLAGSATPLLPARGNRPEILIADFEGDDYGDWKVTGEAFGPGPARGTLPNQMPVTGYLGKGLVNSYFKGDDSVGTLTSPGFTIRRKRINFLVGGGGWPGETCINLLQGGKVVRTATGPNRLPGGTEHLRWHSWDVADLEGKSARIEIVDRRKGGWGHINVDHIVQSDTPPKTVDERDDALARAADGVKAAAGRAQADPDRPTFHLMPPANWLNDPNGPLFYKGYYHLFYQHNPYGDDWGHMHWGHARSKDLVRWEHLPIALWPARERGEDHVFSGCAAFDGKGRPVLFYTSIGPRAPEQWAAVPEDDELIKWKKHPANPILTETVHGKVKVHEWRDPFVFRHGVRTYMVLGGNLNAGKGGQGVVNVYRAENDELTRWKYVGVLFRHPDAGVNNVECPLFFPFGEKWVLIVSPHRKVDYFVGILDGDAMRFTSQKRGVLDPGNFYAPNVLADPKGRSLLWGWVNDFPKGRGWNGCLTLPRVLALGPDGLLRQRPAPELERLRGKPYSQRDVRLASEVRPLKGVRGDALEIRAEIDPGDAAAVGVNVRCSADGKTSVPVTFDGSRLEVAGLQVPFRLPAGEKTLRLHLFLDRSVLEVYANGGAACATRVLRAGREAQGVEVFAREGNATVRSVECWPVGGIMLRP
jgi:sucrose-6-phosphate hydrolase SacC (GH32 family)